MSELLELATILNDGRRRDALLTLAERLGVSVDTVRRWETGRRAMPGGMMLAVRLDVENRELKSRLERIKLALGE